MTGSATPARARLERAAMWRAVELAARGAGTAHPNPVVGCVVLSASGETVGEGWHERPGGPHAEVAALRAAGDRARGGTAVVTLEPCAHQGRTGPCTVALLDAGVRRVVAALRDPYTPAAGGLEVLAAAGVEVELGLLADEAERGNEEWLTAVRRGRPWVVWKYAASLDGRVAAADGSSRWITCPEARADAHRLRAEADAVVVGVGTVLADDPALTVRGPDGTPAARQPLRVVADSAGRTPPHARVHDDAAETLVVTAGDVPPAGDGHGVDPGGLLDLLAKRDVRHVLLEGGPTLAASFLEAGLIDRVVGYVAPAVLGGGGLPAVAGAGAATIGAALRFDLEGVERIGSDLRITARPRRDRTTGGRG